MEKSFCTYTASKKYHPIIIVYVYYRIKQGNAYYFYKFTAYKDSII